jgi:RNA polymerase subunit RPABC4/transcription elongation factor Spt4/putative effector of murein hydrolase LrgA (UPF0299 family)
MIEVKPSITDEVKLIPWWAIGLAIAVFAGLQALMHLVLFPRERYPAPLAFWVFTSLIGAALAFYVLLVGYVSRDARRRGMSVALWTVLVIFVPYAIGFIIYFLLRQPLRSICPKCGAVVDPTFNFCPKCKFNLHSTCPECHRAVRAGDLYCPFCARELTGETFRFSA